MEDKMFEEFGQLSKQIQDLILENKKNKWFNLTNIPLEFCHLSGEVSEAFDAWKKNKEDYGEELADIAIYCFGLAAITDVDLWEQIIKKILKNAKRVYIKTENWLTKTSD